MTAREARLRARIDVLTDERDDALARLRRIEGNARQWQRVTPQSVVDDLLAIAAREGRRPLSRDSARLTKRAKIAYGSWAEAIEAAGWPKPAPRGNGVVA